MNKSSKSLRRLLGALPPVRTQGRPVVRNTGKRFTAKGNRATTVNNPAWGRSLPAAYASHVRPRFNVVARTATAARVSGCDLIYPIPSTLEPEGDTIFAIFPANPAYWSGTRIAQFAPAYQNYRPISFTVSYIPQVAVTQAGTVFMGTLWNEAAPSSNIQQSLFTSNGGCLTQCYVPCDTTIRCANNLPQNLFTVAGALHPDTCPFLFLAGVRGASVIPGYFYVTYTYDFKNPIGSAWRFSVTPNTTVSALSSMTVVDNMTVVLLSGAGDFGPGTQLDLERTPTGVELYYHGSVVDIAGSTPVQVYSNYQSNRDRSSTTLTTAVVTRGAVDTTTPFSSFTLAQESMDIPAGQAAIVIDGEKLRFYNNTSGSPVSGITAGDHYYLYEQNQQQVAVLNASGEVIFTILYGGEPSIPYAVEIGQGYVIQF